MDDKFSQTMHFKSLNEENLNIRSILNWVVDALKEKGYNPLNQIVGYLITGDPTYITSHNNARLLIRKIQRDDILEEILHHYLIENR